MEGAGIGRGFSGDPAIAPAELVQFLDACRQIDSIAQMKQWILDQLQLAAGQSVLDVGCGTGDDVAAAAAVVGPSGSAVGVDWRIPLDAAWEVVGEERAVQGNLEPAVLLGPWERVEAATLDVLRRAGGRPAHVFNLGHGVLPQTDPDVLTRLAELVRDYRHGR